MKFWNDVKELFNIKSKDGRPLTVTAVLGQDSCSRLLSDFADYHLSGSEKLLIIKIDVNGDIDCFSSENMSAIECVGCTSVAHDLFLDGGD